MNQKNNAIESAVVNNDVEITSNEDTLVIKTEAIDHDEDDFGDFSNAFEASDNVNVVKESAGTCAENKNLNLIDDEIKANKSSFENHGVLEDKTSNAESDSFGDFDAASNDFKDYVNNSKPKGGCVPENKTDLVNQKSRTSTKNGFAIVQNEDSTNNDEVNDAEFGDFENGSTLVNESNQTIKENLHNSSNEKRNDAELKSASSTLKLLLQDIFPVSPSSPENEEIDDLFASSFWATHISASSIVATMDSSPCKISNWSQSSLQETKIDMRDLSREQIESILHYERKSGSDNDSNEHKNESNEKEIVSRDIDGLDTANRVLPDLSFMLKSELSYPNSSQLEIQS